MVVGPRGFIQRDIMSVKDSIKAIPMVTLDSATLAGVYAPINPLGLPAACSTLTVRNESNVDLAISYDGVVQHDLLEAGDWLGVLPIQMLAQPPNYRALMPKGTRIYVSAAAGLGNIYLTGFYQD